MGEHQHVMAVTEKNRSTRKRTWCTGRPSRFRGREEGKKNWWGRPGKADRLKIFALNRKEWLLIANLLWLDHNDNIEKHNNIFNRVRPLPDLRVPVICTGFYPSRRHCWCSVTIRLSPFNPYSTKCSTLILSFRWWTRSISSSSNSKESLTYELRIKDYKPQINE